ncbi:hypothetical protein KY290_021250 [Solanum tuberosum]|uniref:Transposase, Ptta/En/Spm, plant n=1 Tax=Solanum tuberosum TaxID=4113 RepID=A0ABQ7V106_SOLTU|nr:hypothetical protein KY290_021250 [Solanum tuberosum]
MPKIKRFKNPLKPANGHASSSTTLVAQDLPVASTNPSQADGVPQQEQTPFLPQQEQPPIALQQEQAPILPSNSSATSLHPRPFARYWRVEAKDSENAIKQINVKVNEVNNLTVGERIIVDFDSYNSAYGDAQGLLAGYCGSLAIDCNLFLISFERWSGQSGMPKKYMEDCFETILKRLWNEYFDPARSKTEIISNVPSGINKDQWASFVAYRLKPSTMELCRRNKEIQRKQKMPHTGGSKANSRRRYEMFLKTGKAPSRGKMFIETHKRKNGSFVNAHAQTIGEQIESHMTHCNTNESEVSPEDIVGKILGAEHSGRVRCMGMGAAPSNTFLNTKRRLSELSTSSSSYDESSATSTYLHQKVARLESKLGGTLNVLKNYMISKEGGIPKELATMFAPQPPPVDAEETEIVSPMDVRGSSADNNANHQSNA